MIADPSHAGGTVQVRFTGLSGWRHQVWCSTDPANWSLVGTSTIPPSGICTNFDNLPLGWSARCQAAWEP